MLRATTACTFSTSQLPKVVRTLRCFVHFDLEMCFAPQRRALFRHRNFQKWSETPSVLYILTWKCASRHNGVQFCIAPVASWLRTRRFSEPTFRPSGATNHWKNTVFRDFPTFSRICIFFLLTLSLLLFSLLIFLFSLHPSLLCFSSVHIVGSLTSKLPSMIPSGHEHIGSGIDIVDLDHLKKCDSSKAYVSLPEYWVSPKNLPDRIVKINVNFA